jgi:hypothetical protein
MLINQPYRTKRSNSIKQGLMTGTVIAMAALFSPCAARDENAGSATVSAVTAAADAAAHAEPEIRRLNLEYDTGIGQQDAAT